MRRYHAVEGLGYGVDQKITVDELGKNAMWETPTGFWVKFKDHQEEIDALYSRFSHPVKYADKQQTVDTYLNPTKFPIGSRVRHISNNKELATVISEGFNDRYGNKSVYVDFDGTGLKYSLAHVHNLSLVGFTKDSINKARSEGEEAGYKKGRDAAFSSLFAEQIKRAVDASVEATTLSGYTKTAKQLINELYHDRARLERVVADAVKIIGGTVDEGLHGRTGSEYLGICQQFVDTHGTDEG